MSLQELLLGSLSVESGTLEGGARLVGRALYKCLAISARISLRRELCRPVLHFPSVCGSHLLSMPRRLETHALNLSDELRARGCMRRTLAGLLLTLRCALRRTLSRTLAGMVLALARMPLTLTLTLSRSLARKVLALARMVLALDARSLSLERHRALPLGNHAIPSIDRRRQLLPARRQLLPARR